MAAKKQARRPPVRRKRQRQWRLPKILLFLSYSAVLVVLGTIFFMKAELRRFGMFGGGRTVESAAPARGSQATANQQKEEMKSATASAAGEITTEEKKQLEDILRSRNSE